jgi:hypothetical protein
MTFSDLPSKSSALWTIIYANSIDDWYKAIGLMAKQKRRSLCSHGLTTLFMGGNKYLVRFLAFFLFVFMVGLTQEGNKAGPIVCGSITLILLCIVIGKPIIVRAKCKDTRPILISAGSEYIPGFKFGLGMQWNGNCPVMEQAFKSVGEELKRKGWLAHWLRHSCVPDKGPFAGLSDEPIADSLNLKLPPTDENEQQEYIQQALISGCFPFHLFKHKDNNVEKWAQDTYKLSIDKDILENSINDFNTHLYKSRIILRMMLGSYGELLEYIPGDESKLEIEYQRMAKTMNMVMGVASAAGGMAMKGAKAAFNAEHQAAKDNQEYSNLVNKHGIDGANLRRKK